MENEELNAEMIRGRVIKGIVALTTRTFILQAIAFLANFLLSIFLIPAQYGTWILVSAAVSFFAFFSDIGLAAALIQKKETPSKEDLQSTFTIQQILVLAIFIIILILTPLFKSYYQLDQNSVYLIIALAFGLILSSLKTIPSVLMERKLDFNKLIIPQIVETLLLQSIAVYLAWRGFGVTSFTIGVLVSGVAGLILIYILQPWKPGFAFSKDSLKKLLKFGVPYQANTFLAVFKDNGVTILLGGIIGTSGVAFLGWAQKWATAPLRFFMDQVIKVTFPAYSRLQDNPKELARAINRSIFFICLLVFPSILGLIIIAPLLTDVIPKYDKWKPALLALSLISINTFFAAITTPLTNFLNAIGKIKITFRLMVMWTVLTWVLIPIFSINYGFNGAALGYSLVGLSSIAAIYVASRYTKLDLLQSVGRPLFAAIIMGVFIFYSKSIFQQDFSTVLILLLLGMIIYIATIFLLVGKSILIDIKKIWLTMNNK